MSEGTFTLTYGNITYPQSTWDRLLRRPRVVIPNTSEPIAFGAPAAEVQEALRKAFGDSIFVRKSGENYVISSR